MNEVVTTGLMSVFLGLMVVGIVLVVLRLNLQRTSKVQQWQRLADQKHWTFTHHPVQSPQWQLSTPVWKLWRTEGIQEDVEARLVFEARLPAQVFTVLLVTAKQWKEWLKVLNLPGVRLREQKLREHNLTHLPGLLHTLSQVEFGAGEQAFKVFSDQPDLARRLLHSEVGELLAALPETQPGGKLWVQIDTKLHIEWEDVEWEEQHVLGLLETGERLLVHLKKEVK